MAFKPSTHDTDGVTLVSILLMIRLHIYSEPFTPEVPSEQDSLEWLLANDLVKPVGTENWYETTARGLAWVKRLLSAGLPIQKWE